MRSSAEFEASYLRDNLSDETADVFETMVLYGTQVAAKLPASEAAKNQAHVAYEAWKHGDTVHSTSTCADEMEHAGWHEAGTACEDRQRDEGWHEEGSGCADYMADDGWHEAGIACEDYLPYNHHPDDECEIRLQDRMDYTVEEARQALVEIHKTHDNFSPKWCPKCAPIFETLYQLGRT